MDDIKNNQDALLQPDQNKDVKPDPSDQLTPDHPRFKEVVAEKNALKKDVEGLREELQAVRESISARQERDEDDDLTENEQAALEKIEKQLRSRNFITKEDLESSSRVQQNALVLEKLTDKFDGSNGYPKFEKQEVVEYAKRNGFGNNFEAAFKDMNYETFVQIDAKKLNETLVPDSEKPTGGSVTNPLANKFTPEQIRDMSPEEYENQREKILGALKPK